MPYKDVDDVLKKMNLSPEELEKYQNIIEEHRKIEAQNIETKKRTEELIPKLKQSYEDFGKSIIRVYEAGIKANNTLQKTINNGKEILETIKENTSSLKKIKSSLDKKLIEEKLKNPQIQSEYLERNKDYQN